MVSCNKIKSCRRCSLYVNQCPAVDDIRNSDIMVVGISSQKNVADRIFIPLDRRTNSGKFVAQLEKCLGDKKFYKTNLVKCVPLDSRGDVRNPTQKEIAICLPHLKREIGTVKPKIVILLGKLVSGFFSEQFNLDLKKYNSTNFGDVIIIPIDHPSYIMIYKRKFVGKYLSIIAKIVNLELDRL